MTARDDVRKLHATRFVEHFVGQDDAARKQLRRSLRCTRICEALENEARFKQPSRDHISYNKSMN